MLRIHRTDTEGETLLRLEGKLAGPWVAELQAVGGSVSPMARLQLDLGAVSFIDAAGLDLLRAWVVAGVRPVACSGLVAQLLAEEGCP
ncbi:MAG TPA: hypothetical protein PKD86_01330 [Gemmatales bacterium]|nr:hypothetical protein [Gemmatales bacterium]HMP57967.1 hypothetical protein [Gemmatales bacterium]